MPFTGVTNTAETRVARWLVENEPVKVQVLGHWPMMPVVGKVLQYARTDSLLPRIGVIVNTVASVPDQSDAATPQLFEFNEFQTRYQIGNADRDRLGIPNNPDEVEYVMSQIKLWYAYFQHLDQATGSASTGGLQDIVATGNILNLSGVSLTLPCIEKAHSLVTAGNGRPSIIMSNSESLLSYRNLCWAAGIAPPEMPWRWYVPSKGWVWGGVTTFHGTPWLINDLMDRSGNVEQNRIYFMVLGDDGRPGPTRGVTGIIPADRRNRLFIKRETQGVPNFGGSTVNTAKDVWVSLTAGLAMGSQGALSILSNFTQIDPCVGG